MKAIVITRPGGPEVLEIAERPMPEPGPGDILVKVEAFGLNRAELHFRRGDWGPVAEISGIECAGVVAEDPQGVLAPAQPVVALMGGLGRSRNGCYAEYVAVPRGHVVPVDSGLAWSALAALPESYATAWTCLTGNLALGPGQVVVVRGATSALGQAAVNIAAGLGARVIATTRSAGRAGLLQRLGAGAVLVGAGAQAAALREAVPDGADAVLDLLGTATLLDSLAMAAPGGRVCIAGFLAGSGKLDAFDPVFQMPSGVQLSAFASAFAFGTAAYPLDAIPFQAFAERAARRAYQAAPARVFRFEDIRAAHALMESNQAGGKLVVSLSD